MSKKPVSIQLANFYSHVFIKHHYGCNGFFGETIGQKYLLHLPSVYGIKMSGENLQIIVLPQGFLHKQLPIFNGLSKFVMSWIDFSKSHFGSS